MKMGRVTQSQVFSIHFDPPKTFTLNLLGVVFLTLIGHMWKCMLQFTEQLEHPEISNFFKILLWSLKVK